MLQLSKRFGRLVQTAVSCLPIPVRRALKQISASTTRHFEVERKYAISHEEFRSLPETLTANGFHFAGQIYMTDTFVPPAQEDGSMIRVRRETMDDKTKTLLTRKFWVEVQGNRERDEDEEEIPELAASTLLELGLRLTGGKPLLAYSKERDLYKKTTDDGQKVVVSLDTVEELGEYSGHYMEIEILVPVGKDVEPAREFIASMVKTLTGEDRPFVKLSYQEMLKRSLA